MSPISPLRQTAQTVAANLPSNGWQTDKMSKNQISLRHADRPGLIIEASINSKLHLHGQTFDVWLRTPNGTIDILRESTLRGRDLSVAAITDLRWTYGPEGRAANALIRLIGAAWAGPVSAAWLRIDLHRASAPYGEIVLHAHGRERRRRLPGGTDGPLARVTNENGHVRHVISITPICHAELSAHARLAMAEEARNLARTCGLDNPTADTIMHRVLRDLVAIPR